MLPAASIYVLWYTCTHSLKTEERGWQDGSMGKVLAVKPDNLVQFPGPTWWKDRNNSSRECVEFCLYTCCMHHMHASYTLWKPGEAVRFLELQLWATMWVLGTKLMFSARTASDLLTTGPFLQTSNSILRLVLTIVAQSHLKLFIFWHQSSKY